MCYSSNVTDSSLWRSKFFKDRDSLHNQHMEKACKRCGGEGKVNFVAESIYPIGYVIPHPVPEEMVCNSCGGSGYAKETSGKTG